MRVCVRTLFYTVCVSLVLQKRKKKVKCNRLGSSLLFSVCCFGLVGEEAGEVWWLLWLTAQQLHCNSLSIMAWKTIRLDWKVWNFVFFLLDLLFNCLFFN